MKANTNYSRKKIGKLVGGIPFLRCKTLIKNYEMTLRSPIPQGKYQEGEIQASTGKIFKVLTTI